MTRTTQRIFAILRESRPEIYGQHIQSKHTYVPLTACVTCLYTCRSSTHLWRVVLAALRVRSLLMPVLYSHDASSADCEHVCAAQVISRIKRLEGALDSLPKRLANLSPSYFVVTS